MSVQKGMKRRGRSRGQGGSLGLGHHTLAMRSQGIQQVPTYLAAGQHCFLCGSLQKSAGREEAAGLMQGTC